MGFLSNLFKPKAALPKYHSSVRSYLDSYDDKPVYTIVDLGLADVAPSTEYSRYIAIILPVKINPEGEGAPVADSELKALHAIEERCIREAESKGYLYAGHAIVTAAEHMYIAFYCKEADKNEVISSLMKICQAGGREPTRVVSKDDREWGFYLERLYPDVYRMQEINHLDIIEDIKKHGDTGEQPRPVLFYLFFGAREDAQNCLEEATGNGLELENLHDLREDKSFKGKRPFSLALKREMPLTIEGLNEQAWRLIDLAKQYNGEYDGIETDVFKGG